MLANMLSIAGGLPAFQQKDMANLRTQFGLMLIMGTLFLPEYELQARQTSTTFEKSSKSVSFSKTKHARYFDKATK